MSQSGVIAAILLAAFVLFLAANNRLKTYMAVLWGGTRAPTPSGGGTSGGTSGGSSGGSDLGTFAKAAELYAAFA